MVLDVLYSHLVPLCESYIRNKLLISLGRWVQMLKLAEDLHLVVKASAERVSSGFRVMIEALNVGK